MLEAVIRNQFRLNALRTGTHFPMEDLLTSTVLGPLRYWTANELYILANELLAIPPAECQPNFMELGDDPVCLEASLALWPQYKAVQTDERYVEPDAVLEIRQSARRLALVIEAKWDSALTAAQITRQATAIGSGAPIAGSLQVIHLILVRKGNKARVISDLADEPDDSFRQSVVHYTVLDWNQLIGSIRRVGQISGSVGIQGFGEDLQKFLSKLGDADFFGFIGGHFAAPQIWKYRSSFSLFHGFRRPPSTPPWRFAQ